MKPHVIIIMADQLRADVLGKGFTPTIDALKQEGVAFDRTYCACPLCVPSRGAFFSGMHPNSNGSLINPWEPEDAHYGDMKSSIDTLYTLMENTWDSLHSGKQHVFTEGGNLENRKDSPTTWLATEATYKQYLHNAGKCAPGGPSFKTKVPEMVDGKVTKVSRYSNAEVGVYEEGEAYYFDSYYADKAVEGLRARDKDK
ncbi:MAG: sulfatase-like hydrolase/transferase, partial [Sphaerochaeta sp.]